MEKLVTCVLNMNSAIGANGCMPSDFHNKTATCDDKHGHVYDITLKVIQTEKG